MWQLWFTIRMKKTGGIYISASTWKPYKKPTITLKDQRLQVVDKFTYIGSRFSRVVHIDDEVIARIAKASAAFGQLHVSIWDGSGIRFDAKLKVYRSVVLPTLLYACEFWTVYQRHAKWLNHFHTNCLRKLLKIQHTNRVVETDCTGSSKVGRKIYQVFSNDHPRMTFDIFMAGSNFWSNFCRSLLFKQMNII